MMRDNGRCWEMLGDDGDDEDLLSHSPQGGVMITNATSISEYCYTPWFWLRSLSWLWIELLPWLCRGGYGYAGMHQVVVMDGAM